VNPLSAFAAWREGVARVNSAPAVLVGTWLITLAVSLPLALVMRGMIAQHLGDSLAADSAANGVNYEWMQEFGDQATGVGVTLKPTIIGFGAVLDNVSGFLDNTPRPLVISGLAFALFPRAITRLVTNQENVIAAALPLMLVAAVFQLSDGIQAVGAGVLRGAADTRYAFVANLIGHWGVGLPVALLLGFTFHLGIVGLWWGLCVGLTVVAVLLFLRFERLSRGEIQPI